MNACNQETIRQLTPDAQPRMRCQGRCHAAHLMLDRVPATQKCLEPALVAIIHACMLCDNSRSQSMLIVVLGLALPDFVHHFVWLKHATGGKQRILCR